MARPTDPYPFDVLIDGQGYLQPPPSYTRFLRDDGVFIRDSMDWFPERVQAGESTEANLPPESERTVTVTNRSRGFGWSDTPESDASPRYVYAYTDAVDSASAGDGQGVDCSCEGVAVLGPKINVVDLTGAAASIRASFELTISGTRWQYVVAGTKMFRSSDGSSWSAVQANATDLPAALTGSPQVFQGSQTGPLVYFPMGASQTFRVWDGAPASAFGVPTTTDLNKWIDCVQIEDELLVLWYDTTNKNYSVSKFADGIASASAGATPTYTPSIPVSDGSDPAQSLMFANDIVYIGCNRFLKTLDAERASLHESLWEATQPSTNNFRWWTQYRDELWFTAGQGTYRISPESGAQVFEQIGPETLPNNRTPVRGVIRAMAADDYCLYCFLRTEAGVTFLLKFRYYTDLSNSQRYYAFHSISRIGAYDVDYAFVSTIQGTSPRLFFGTSDFKIRYCTLPRNGFYPPSDPLYEYCDKGYLYGTRAYGGYYFVNKVLIAFTGRVDDATSTEKVTPAYSTAELGTFTEFGTEITSEPGTRCQLPLPVVATWWESRIKLERGSTVTATPKLYSATFSYAVRPIAKGHFTLNLWLTDYATERNGIKDRRSVADMTADLINLDSRPTLVTIVDRVGAEYFVLVDQVRYWDVYRDADRTVDRLCRLTASEFGTRTIGSHDVLARYTHDQLAAFTHDQMAQLVG